MTLYENELYPSIRPTTLQNTIFYLNLPYYLAFYSSSTFHYRLLKNSSLYINLNTTIYVLAPQNHVQQSLNYTHKGFSQHNKSIARV